MWYEIGQPHGLRYSPFKALVVPRPIGWITSISAEGRVNLAPFSFFNGVSADPPMVMFSCNGLHADGGVKDSVANVEATGEFVVNLASWDLRDQMNQTSAMVPRETNEMELAGLAAAPSRLVRPPRVAASPAHLECRLLQIVRLPDGARGAPNFTVFGRVVAIHVDDRFIRDGLVDTAAMRPIARLGYHDYSVVDAVFALTRPGE